MRSGSRSELMEGSSDFAKAGDPSLGATSGRKTVMLECISELQNIANDMNADASAELLKSVEQRLREERFHVVVLGDSSEGNPPLSMR
ncbi:MAG: hypothetical protein ACUVT7_04460 [Thermoplasmata archaeon]